MIDHNLLFDFDVLVLFIASQKVLKFAVKVFSGLVEMVNGCVKAE